MLKVYHYLNEVCKTGNFSEAAKNLYISQPSLSITIRNFEEQLGIKLLDRSCHPVMLTEEGAVFMDGVARILSIEKELDTYIEEIKGMKIGSLSLGATYTFGVRLLPELMEVYHAKYPNITLSMKQADVFSLSDMLLSGKADIVIASSKVDPNNFVMRPFQKEYILLAVPAEYPVNEHLRLAGMSPEEVSNNAHMDVSRPQVPLEEFKDIAFIMLEEGLDMYTNTLAFCEESGFDPIRGITCNQLFNAYSLVARGFGVSLVSDTVIKCADKSSPVILYKVRSDDTVRDVLMIYRKRRHLSKAMDEFIKMASDRSTTDIGASGSKNI